MRKLVVICSSLLIACSAEPSMNSNISVGAVARTDAKVAVESEPANPQEPISADIIQAPAEVTVQPRTEVGIQPVVEDESVTPPTPITGVNLICSTVSINPANHSQGTVTCTLQKNGQKFELPASATLVWGSRDGRDLEFTFTDLPATAAEHVSVLIQSPSNRLSTTVVLARITATIDDQYLESPLLRLPSTTCAVATVITGNGGADIRWNAVSGAAGYLLVRRLGGLPTFAVENGRRYTVGSVGSDTILVAGSQTSYSDGPLPAGTSFVGYLFYVYDQFSTYTLCARVAQGI